MRTTLLGVAGVAIGAVMLTGCGNTTTPTAQPSTSATPTSSAKPPASGSASTTSGAEKTPVNDNSCGPVEICGTATVSGGAQLTTSFFSVLSDLNNKRCADWAKGADKTLDLPKVNNSERTVSFYSPDPITYHGPDTYSGADLLKDGSLQVDGKTYDKGKGKAEVHMSDNGDGSITLTDWTADGTGPVTFKATWTCKDR